MPGWAGASGRGSAAPSGGAVAVARSAGGLVASAPLAAPFADRAGSEGVAPSEPSSSTEMRAITCPTVTVSPSATSSSLTVPVAGEGSSTSTLSVEISTIVSSCLIRSPTLTCHSRIVPSVTDSPAAGVTTSTVRTPVVPVAISVVAL